jgi:tetratricopeptide (TPR) repeat protein
VKTRLTPALLLLLFFAFSAFAQNKRTRVRDSLVTFLRNAPRDTSRLNALDDLIYELKNLGKYDSALTISRQTLEFAQTLPEQQRTYGMVSCYSNTGLVHYEMGSYAEALKEYLAARKLIEAYLDTAHAQPGIIRMKRMSANVSNNSGLVYQNQGNYPEALSAFFASLKLREEVHDLRGAASTHNNIGITYKNQGNYADALHEYQATIQTANELVRSAKTEPDLARAKKILAHAHNNVGGIYYLQHHFQQALDEFMLALRLRTEMGDQKSIADSHNNIGLVYEDEGMLSEARIEYLASLRIYEALNDQQGIAAASINQGSVLLKLKKMKEASVCLSRALLVSRSIGYKDGMKQSYLILAEADSALGDWKKGLDDFRMYVIYRDSMTNEENTRKTVQAQMNYAFAKQQAADSVRNAEALAQEGLKHEQEIRQQRLYTFGGIIGFALMLVVAGVSFNAYRQKQKANEIISRQKQLVEEKQKEILDSIHYAKRIQQALLTSEGYIGRELRKFLGPGK